MTPVQPPFAAGGLSSPIENAFAHLSAASIHIPAGVPMITNDKNIDPALLERGNYSPSTPPISNYQIPGATIDHALAIADECLQESGPAEKLSVSRKAGCVPAKTQGPKNLRMQKQVLARGAAVARVRALTQVTENEPAAADVRTCKCKLNPDGEEFTNPKKGKHT